MVRQRRAREELQTLTPVESGGVTSAMGFRAAGVHAGFYSQADRLDCALVVADRPCSCAAMFTQNAFCAAPVRVSREHLQGMPFGMAQAVLINAGNANAATGHKGIEAARRSAELVAESLGCRRDEVLVASTGAIGVPMPLAPIEKGVPLACASLSTSGGSDAARAIMTNDIRTKESAVSYVSDAPGFRGRRFAVGGMAKGSGMVMPEMATMIAVLTTDAPLAPVAAHSALSEAVSVSFNKVTVDSDTSTNDCCILLTSDTALCADPQAKPIKEGSRAFDEFSHALNDVCVQLARQIAADGEGATRLITVNVSHAFDEADADRVGRAVANSPLVKSAAFGHHALWGGIVASVGRTGAIFRADDVTVDVMGIPVCRNGTGEPFDEAEVARRFAEPEIVIDIDLGAGDASTSLWTCDYSPGYARIDND